MIPAAKFSEMILKVVLISGVSDREQEKKKGRGKESLHHIQTGNNFYNESKCITMC
jgi:hypothetical protein